MAGRETVFRVVSALVSTEKPFGPTFVNARAASNDVSALRKISSVVNADSAFVQELETIYRKLLKSSTRDSSLRILRETPWLGVFARHS